MQLEHGIYDRKPIEDIDNGMYVQIVDLRSTMADGRLASA